MLSIIKYLASLGPNKEFSTKEALHDWVILSHIWENLEGRIHYVYFAGVYHNTKFVLDTEHNMTGNISRCLDPSGYDKKLKMEFPT